MAGINLQAIHRALADQIRTYLTANGRDTNVSPFPGGILQAPQITVEPYGPYLSYFETMGPNGECDMMVRLRLEVDAMDSESIGIKMCDYLGVGTGNGSSVVDAVMSDRTLGSTVESCVLLTAEWSVDDLATAFLPIGIILKKQNARA